MDDQIAEGDQVCSRATTCGTHQGKVLGIPATGKVVTMTGMTTVRIVDGQITDGWVKNDVMGLMNQLNAGSASR
ncbi:MAG: ester cyclase [Oculatellaceae cyanobacterium bins.114]|nr:ester cyclase [Oculatellaceae cyanobacterium bins.114]